MKVKRVGSSQSTAPATNRIPWVCASCLRSERFIIGFRLHGVGKPPWTVLSLRLAGGVPAVFGFNGRLRFTPRLVVLEKYAPELHGLVSYLSQDINVSMSVENPAALQCPPPPNTLAIALTS